MEESYTALCDAVEAVATRERDARTKSPSAYAYIVSPMGCFIALLALFSPRLALVAIWLFSDLLSRAFDSWLLPLLGFFLLPWTTLAYAVMWSTGTNEVSGFEWFIVALGFLVDLGSYANGRRSRAAHA